MIRGMTLLAYVWVADAIVCMVDSKTTATGPTGDQESLNTIKSVTYPLGVADRASEPARAVLMVAGRNVFTPEVNNKPTGEPSATAIEIVADALADLGPTYTDIGELGEAVWPALRARMYDCHSCRDARQAQVDDEKAYGMPADAPFDEREAECHSFPRTDGTTSGHEVALHVAGFHGPNREAVRYRRRWHYSQPSYQLAMQEGSVYLSSRPDHHQNLPSITVNSDEEIDEHSRTFRELQDTYRAAVAEIAGFADSVGGPIRTTVLHRSGTSTSLPSWYLQ